MTVEIELPEHVLGEILSDISSNRGGHILGIKSVNARFPDHLDQSQDLDMSRRCLSALMPLSEMVGYTRFLRSVSKGEATFIMNFSHYEKLSG
jgi:elongation factor G